MEKISLEHTHSSSSVLHNSNGDNDDSGSDGSECIYANDDKETSKLISKRDAIHPDAAYRRSLNNNNNKKNEKLFQYAYDEFDLQSHQKLRQTQSRTSRQFLFLFSFATSLIILSQVYLSLYYSDPLGRATISGWDRNKTRSIPFYILPNVNTTVIQPPSLCKGNDTIVLLIVICSAVNNFEIRQTLRETWANTTEFNYSAFAKIHSNSKGKYLHINYPNWRNFTIKNEYQESDSLLPDDDTAEESTQKSSKMDFSVKTVFLVGQTDNNETQEKILEESELYSDLIQENFVDTYNNLTLKTIMMLKWVNTNCADKFKFLMKCDDDTFVNVPNLLHFLLGGTIPVYNATIYEFNELTIRTLSAKNRLAKHKNLLIGSRFCRSKPIGDVSNKWFTPHYMYDKKIYPNYLSGTGYVMTSDSATKLYNVSLVTPLLHLEDVYLTGICAEVANIKPENYHLFSYLSFKDFCEFKGMITKHEIKPTEMKKAYDYVMSTNITCSIPSTKAKVRRSKMSKNCN